MGKRFRKQTETITWYRYPKKKPKEIVDKTFLVNWDNGAQVMEAYFMLGDNSFYDVNDRNPDGKLTDVTAWAELPKGWNENKE